MNKQTTLACTLSMLAVALLLLVPFAFLLAPSDIAFDNGTGAGTVQYSYDNLFKSGTVLSDRVISYPLEGLNDVRDLATGDLNNDGVIDVAVATATKVIISYGTGNGALGNSFTLPITMSDARKMVVGDLDGDGKADIAVTYIDPSDGFPRVGIFYQKDSFSKSTNLQIQTYGDPWQLVIGDFSNSGVNGLAVICRGEPENGDPATLMLLRSPYVNLADKKYIELSGLDNLKLLAAGQVNTDGRLDLVVGDAYGSSIVILTQPASFSISWSPVTLDIGSSITDIIFMDYAGSGTKKDLVAVKYGVSSGQIEVRLNVGGIPASASYSFTFNGASSIAVGGVTGASAQDLVVLSSSNNAAKFYPHQGNGLDAGVYSQFPVNTGPIKAVAAYGGVYVLSLGGTARPTVEFYKYADSRISNADGNFFVSNGQPQIVCAGDVSFGIIATVYDGQNAVYISSPSGASRTIITSSVPSSLYIGDLDGDSVGDLAIALKNSNSISIYKGSSSFMSNDAPLTFSIPSPLSDPQSMTGGRIEAIGKDVLVVGCLDGIDVIYNPLSGTPIHETIVMDDDGERKDIALGVIGPSSAGAGIAALNIDNNNKRVEIYYLKQSPTVGDCFDSSYNAWLNPQTSVPSSITIGDFDANGWDDVATISTKQLKIYSNAGSGFSSGGSLPAASIALTESANQVCSGDINDDGKDDLVVKYTSIAEIGIWLSRGSLTFSNPFDMTAGGVASSICIADINRDGRDDITASSLNTRALSYWLQRSLIPDANLWYSDTTRDTGESIGFDASNSTDSTSDISSLAYLWDFGDGTTSTQVKTQHLYTVEGVKSCSLVVTDRSGLADRIDFQITVNKPMEVRINATEYNPMVREAIWLQDESIVPNGIASFEWDFDNGVKETTNHDVSIAYTQPGYYTVRLTITDLKNHTSSSTAIINVKQYTNPIGGIVANGGQTSFFMDQEIFFEVIIEDGTPISGFEWDMDYNGDFNATTGITLNQTIYSYNQTGEYTICVRNHNVQSMTDEFLTIHIMNFRPVADIKATLNSFGNYTFDASRSWDTVTDNSTLEYRWNSGDGNSWTNYGSETRYTWEYEAEGIFNVTLEVRDQHGYVGSTYLLVVVDSSPPAISLDSGLMDSKTYRGDDLVVKVNVTDPSGIGQVRLIYTTNNVTKTLIMSQVSGTNTYVATIPAKDVNSDLSYFIEAEDTDGHITVSAAMGVSLIDRPDAFLMYLLIAISAAVGVFFLLYYRSRMIVDDVFIIYQDGNLMAHQTRRLKPGMDDQILGSMLVAIQEFVKDSFKDESSTRLNRMDFGEKKVLVEKGDHIYLAVVLHGKREGRVPQRMKDTIAKAENDYFQALDGWDGDLEKVRGIKDETDPLLKPGLKDIMSSIPFLSKESAEPVEMTACPYCESSYPATEPKCPKCGTAPESKPSPGEADETGGQAA